MKIIARIDASRLVVEMTEREIANLVGLNYPSQLPHNYRYEDALVSGAEFNVHAAWNRLEEQARIAEKLEGVSKTLTALSDLVTQTKVGYTNAIESKGGGE